MPVTLIASRVLAGILTLCSIQSAAYGPEIKSFLEFVRHEEVELNFQIAHNEISRRDYTRSKARLDVQREAVLNRFKETGEDLVPEYHVVTASEVEELIPEGESALKTARKGDMVQAKWRYLGSAIRGEKFYVLERVTDASQ